VSKGRGTEGGGKKDTLRNRIVLRTSGKHREKEELDNKKKVLRGIIVKEGGPRTNVLSQKPTSKNTFKGKGRERKIITMRRYHQKPPE